MKSAEYLESKTVQTGEFWENESKSFKPHLFVTLEHAKTYGKIVELEKEIILIKTFYKDLEMSEEDMEIRIQTLESEIKNLIKL